MPGVSPTPLSLLDGNHRASRPALPGCHALHPHELVLPDSVSNSWALPSPCNVPLDQGDQCGFSWPWKRQQAKEGISFPTPLPPRFMVLILMV